MQKRNWDFFHSKASDATWTPGLREIFEYRDLGYKDATKGDYVAHIVRANGKEMSDEVQEWHRHVCDFQFVYVLDGWAEFEYAGHGVHRIEKGDCIQQTPLIPHREIEGLCRPGNCLAGEFHHRNRRRTGSQRSRGLIAATAVYEPGPGISGPGRC